MFPKEKLDKYIEYFKEEQQSYYTIERGYISYDETINTFIKDFYKYDMIDIDYMDNIHPYIEKKINLQDIIKNADISIIKSILTFYIRGDRFNEGMIAEAIDEEIFLKALIKLKNIQEN